VRQAVSYQQELKENKTNASCDRSTVTSINTPLSLFTERRKSDTVCDFAAGGRVLVAGTKLGTVRFVGNTQFASGKQRESKNAGIALFCW